ncbi:Smr/MutS family protein [Bartonella sp. DGB2]|uniref:Smr/MutS family protein n=1 Tax=Bartonella sp. DGB2 TaxID=3388426 RepID=UPI00398FC150
MDGNKQKLREAQLQRDDQALWAALCRTITPLPRRRSPLLPPAVAREECVPATFTKPYKYSAVQSAIISSPLSLHLIDLPTQRKIAKGRISLEAKLDLHGLCQARAHQLLYDFIMRAYQQRFRHVLVITGRGKSYGSAGVLREMVPHWLKSPLFLPLIGAYQDASSVHGGKGALYIRIRRPQP